MNNLEEQNYGMKTLVHNEGKPACMIGTWAWGTGMNGSKMVFGCNYSEEQLMETFNKAYESGFHIWDTAEVYGMGNFEKLLGKCIEGKEDVIISTKYLPGKKYKHGAIRESLAASISRLGVSYIDLYWFHQPFCLKENITEAIELLQEGKIKNLGVSNCTLEEIKEADKLLKKSGFRLAAVQNHFSLLSMGDEQMKVIKWCQENHIIYFGYMILEQGALSGHYDSKHPFPRFSMRGFSFNRNKFKKIQKLLDYERNLATKYNVDSSQIPIAWAVSKQIVPIVGITKEKHAAELAKGIKIVLTSDEITNLETLAEESKVICKGNWEKN